MPYRPDHVETARPALEEILQRRVRDGRAPASSGALLTPAGVVATASAGDGTTTPAPPPGAAFRVASCTKSLTAATLLTLVADGALALDQPLDDVLDVAVLGASRAPTIGELASMSGGIPVDDPWADRQESIPAEAMDALLADGVRLVAEPGARYEYSSLGYAILGRVLERVTGTPYPALVAERLLQPLGLTGIGYDRTVDAPVVPGYARVEGAWTEQPWAEPGAFSALGGVIASPTALGTWAGWLAAAHREGASDDVLSAAARRTMQEGRTEVPGSAGSAYGLGLVVEQDPRHGRVVSHSGGYPGYGAHMRWHPESGIGVVVLENARYSGATAPATQALTLLLDAARVEERELDLWPETRAAWDLVEGLLRRWDDAALEAAASDNLALDETFALRRREAERLAGIAGLDPEAPVPALRDAAARSDSPAHLVWSVRGRSGALRCEVRLTPVRDPKVQTLAIRLG